MPSKGKALCEDPGTITEGSPRQAIFTLHKMATKGARRSHAEGTVAKLAGNRPIRQVVPGGRVVSDKPKEMGNCC